MTKEELRNKLAQMSEDLLKMLKEYMAEHAEMKGDPEWSGWISVDASTNPNHRTFSVYESKARGEYESISHIAEYKINRGWKKSPSGEEAEDGKSV